MDWVERSVNPMGLINKFFGKKIMNYYSIFLNLFKMLQFDSVKCVHT